MQTQNATQLSVISLAKELGVELREIDIKNDFELILLYISKDKKFISPKKILVKEFIKSNFKTDIKYGETRIIEDTWGSKVRFCDVNVK